MYVWCVSESLVTNYVQYPRGFVGGCRLSSVDVLCDMLSWQSPQVDRHCGTSVICHVMLSYFQVTVIVIYPPFS